MSNPIITNRISPNSNILTNTPPLLPVHSSSTPSKKKNTTTTITTTSSSSSILQKTNSTSKLPIKKYIYAKIATSSFPSSNHSFPFLNNGSNVPPPLPPKPSSKTSFSSSKQQQPSVLLNQSIKVDPKKEELNGTHKDYESSSSSSIRVQEIIQTYSQIDPLIEMQDEGLKILRSYLKQRQNEEYLLYMEVTREYKKKRELRQNEQPTILLLEEFEKVYHEFLNFESVTCMNVPASVREQFVNVWNEKEIICKSLDVLSLSTDSCNSNTACHNVATISLELAQKMRKCLDDLFISVQIQFKNEIMPHFKKTEDFKTFLLTKLIELSSQPQQDSNPSNSASLSPETVLIQDFLTQNGELSKYCKAFSKKNLITMEQIRNFTSDDFRDKIGIKKIGHLKRMVRLTRQHFMHE
ncbi:hypothetical protein FDP41_009916 [Naegleria fowleri]|uniref:SAM domain-containing protein n=1 Tax=Naegleria fowleri TaxID=5763 RepID=A0A6A5ATA1_NAEFO|nr:uncharacterized protein FDP41_009916 [Naegleria fowleri]KAF0971693.1 hypothetical protein FDP41_009916 [Naegleria fowleri]